MNTCRSISDQQVGKRKAPCQEAEGNHPTECGDVVSQLHNTLVAQRKGQPTARALLALVSCTDKLGRDFLPATAPQEQPIPAVKKTKGHGRDRGQAASANTMPTAVPARAHFQTPNVPHLARTSSNGNPATSASTKQVKPATRKTAVAPANRYADALNGCPVAITTSGQSTTATGAPDIPPHTAAVNRRRTVWRFTQIPNVEFSERSAAGAESAGTHGYVSSANESK